MIRDTASMLAAVSLIVAAPLLQAPQVFRSGASGVIVNVSVLDGRKAVAGLTRADFELRDNGVLQSILDTSLESLPVDVTFTVDMSGSISADQQAQLLGAMHQVAVTLRPGDRYRLLSFTRRVREYIGWSAPTTTFDLSAAEPGPSTNTINTALLDAAALTLLTGGVPDRRQLALVLTDGYENMSFLEADGLVEAVRYSDAVMHVIIANGRGRPSVSSRHWDALSTAASNTGGRLVELNQEKGISAAFLAAIEEFRASYVLRYTATGVPRSGWHDIKVKVKTGKYETRARKGYVGGDR